MMPEVPRQVGELSMSYDEDDLLWETNSRKAWEIVYGKDSAWTN